MLGFCGAAACVCSRLPSGALKAFALGYLSVGGCYWVIGMPSSSWGGDDLPTNALVRWIGRQYPAATASAPNLLLTGNSSLPMTYFLGQGAGPSYPPPAATGGPAGGLAAQWLVTTPVNPVQPPIDLHARTGHWLWTIAFGLAGGALMIVLRGKRVTNTSATVPDSGDDAHDDAQDGSPDDAPDSATPPGHLPPP